MAKVKVLSDSTCDLSKDLIEKYDIGILPMYVNFAGETFRDNGVDINSQKIYDYVDKTGVLPGTVAIPMAEFKEEFEKWRSEGYNVICHTISSDMSCCYQNAKIAADEMDGVYVIDSRNLSTGIGHLVMNSAELAKQGMSAENIVKSTQELIPKVRSSFVIDTLDYMKKGGRCSSVTALGANLLKIKPMIVVEDGKMKVARKYRGLISKVILNYVDDQLEGRTNIRTHRIFITHTGCSPELVESVRDRVSKYLHFDEIIETEAGATVTSHSGPNTLGILFVEK